MKVYCLSFVAALLLFCSQGCKQDAVTAPNPSGFKAPEPVQAMDSTASPGRGGNAPPQESSPVEAMVIPD